MFVETIVPPKDDVLSDHLTDKGSLITSDLLSDNKQLANGILKHSEFNYPRMRRLYDIQPLDLFLQKLTVYSTKIIPELYDGGVDGFLDDFVFKDERLE